MSRTASLCPAGIVTTARTFSRLTSVPVASSMRAMTTSSSGWRRMVSSTACSIGLPLQRMAGHQLVGMHPAGKRADTVEPRADARVIAPRYAELVRPVQVAAHRDVGNRGFLAHRIIILQKVRIENPQCGLDAPAQELRYRRLTRFLELDEKAQGRDVACELVVVPQDPAQHLQLVFALKFREVLGEVMKDHPGLRQALAAVLQHRHLAHLVNSAVLGGARLAAEEVDEARLPFRPA